MPLLSARDRPGPPTRAAGAGPQLSRLAHLRPGDRLGGYQVEGGLGRGGMGRVYRAFDPRLKRTAAIKVMGAASDAEAARRFEREAQAIASLRHPNILAVYGYGEQQDEPYMVLEFMENGSLGDHPEWLPMDPEQTIRVLRPVAAALDHAHRRGVIHRDVKPANIFLDAEMRPVLGDFGLSQLSRTESLTTPGTVTGTPTFVSPEQARGQRLTGASDIYSLAVTAYQLLTGELPFRPGGDALAVLYQHVNELPPPPSQVRANLPSAVDPVLLRGLAKSPGDRWGSAVEMIDALAAALGVQPVMATPRPIRGRRPPRLPLALLGVITAAAAVLAGATWGMSRSARESLPPASVAHGTLVVETAQPLRLGGVIRVHGGPLDPARPARIYIEQAGAGAQIEDDLAITIRGDGSFDETGVVNSGLQPGKAVVKACSLDGAGRVDDPTCLRSAVTLAR